ncbi:unnamed protein product [Absidia cylindrospora]
MKQSCRVGVHSHGKGVHSRAAQQQQQQNQLLQPPEFTPNYSSSDISCSNGYSDTNSIPSRASSDRPRDIGTDENRLTISEPVDSQDFRDYFSQVSLNDPLLQDFHCTLRHDSLVQGQLFITKSFVCFKSNAPDSPTTTVEFNIENIKLIDLVRPGRWKPRMIQITLKNDAKYTFTTFLPSTTSRDEAYQCLMNIWKPPSPSVASVAASSSTPSLSAILPTTVKSAPECDGSDTTCDSNYKSNESLATTAPTTPVPTGPFKIFQRKRAQTMTSQTQQEPQKNRSVISSSTTLAKSLNTHISWNDGQPQHAPSTESDLPTTTTSPTQPPILLNQKTKPSSGKTQSSPLSPSATQHPVTRINTRAMLLFAGFLLLLSHVFLTYEFYHMTHLLTTRQLQQHQHQQQQRQQSQDVSWLSDQLETATRHAQRWEKETIQQRRRLMDMIPT